MTRTPIRLPLALFLLSILLSPLVWAHGMSEEERQAISAGGNLAYMQIGATHMLTGYDHLLFVLGIIFFLRSFRDIVKYVTAFTVGHSITLIMATFNGIQLNYFLIDAIVGLSVCYIAFANIDGFRRVFQVEPPNMMAMIFGLGLVHGFGLSSRLQELPLAEESLDLLLNIISFNIGIELGQVFALLVMILAMDIWRKRPSFAKLSIVCNQLLIVAGALLFLYQMHGYAHTLPQEGAVATGPEIATVPDAGYWQDTITVTIPPHDGREYKFLLGQGATLEYAWQVSGGTAVYYDMHGEPKGDTSGYFKSFEENTAARAKGSLTSEFAGNHGWYWQNNSASPVVITLMARGNYTRIDVPNNNVNQPREDL